MTRLLIVISLFFAMQAQANTALMPEDIKQSTALHYPEILAAAQKQAAAKAIIQQKRGAFDATVEQNATSRLSGFYDGQQIDTRVVQPLSDFNSNIYGGYRISDGNFPIYEDRLITNNQGEILVGAELSLLRDNMIDERRAALTIAKIKSDTTDIDAFITQLDIELKAISQYWRWVAIGKQLQVLESILELMQTRQSGLVQRHQKGDIAKIYLTENQQYITQRKSDIVEAQRKFKEAAFELSLFYRNVQGEPIIPSQQVLPEAFPLPEMMKEEALLVKLIDLHPELARFEQAKLEQEQNYALGENQQLPKADLQLEFSDDLGRGNLSRQQAESVIKLNVSIPLEQNLAKGRMSEAKAEIRRLDYLEQLRKEQLQTQLANLLMELRARNEAIELAQEEINFAEQMETAERNRFSAGGSDFFLINLRQEALANAKIKEIQANTQYQLALTKLDTLTSTITLPE